MGMGIDEGDDIYSFHLLLEIQFFGFVSVGPVVTVIVNTSSFAQNRRRVELIYRLRLSFSLHAMNAY